LSASDSTTHYKRRRVVELKHGCVYMFATICYIVPGHPTARQRASVLLLPTYGVEFADVPNSLKALSKVPAISWCQIVAFAGVIELHVYNVHLYGLALGYYSCIAPVLCLGVTIIVAHIL